MAELSDLHRIKGYAISPELFATGFAAGSGPCACDASCCLRGAYTDPAERDRILAHADLIKAHLDDTQPRDEAAWFESEEKVDPDFPSGRCVGTAVAGGKCALLDVQGRCSLQLAAVAAGMHRWALKPLYCYLYPLEIADRVIRIDPRRQNERACCTVQPVFDVPLFEACRDELAHLLGEDGMAALRSRHAELRGARSATVADDAQPPAATS